MTSGNREGSGEAAPLYFLCDFETTGVNPVEDYPIELGGLLLESDFSLRGVFDSLINPFPEAKRDWEEGELGAAALHNITVNQLKRRGHSPRLVVEELMNFFMSEANINPLTMKRKKVILVSDNAQFEYWFMKRLFELSAKDGGEWNWPFHYGAWDTNILLCALCPEIGDPDPVHRALPDTIALYRNVLLALAKTGFQFQQPR